LTEAKFREALINLGIDLDTLPSRDALKPPPPTPPYRPLSDGEWRLIHQHIGPSVAAMRPCNAGRAFIENLLICEHSQLSTRYLPEDQEGTRQRALRWSLDGRLEKLAADLRAAGQLDDDRLAAFEAIAANARQTRQRIIGVRAVRLDERTAAAGARAPLSRE
jgi:hypothetical protein